VWPRGRVHHKAAWPRLGWLLFNAVVTSDAVSDYRVAPVLAARLFGVALGLVGLLVFGVSVVVAVARLPVWPVAAVAAVGVLAVAVAGWWVTRHARVVRLDDIGYQVHFVRGAGAPSARWADVVDAGTRTVAGSPCVVLRLRDGRTTTIPVDVLAADRERFSADVRARLERGRA